MSIFDQGDQTQTPQSFVDQLVATKGDNFRDPEAMAKSLLEKENHIKKVEAENAAYRESQTKADFGQELLKELRSQTPASGETVKTETNTGGATEVTPQTGPEDIKKLIEEAITTRESESSKAQNIAQVDKTMTERFGDQAQAELVKRSSELGMSVEKLSEIAGESPTAFLKLIGEAPAVQTNSTVKSAVNTAALSNESGKRDWSFYKELMRTDEKRYRSRAVQDQMEKDLNDMGDSFWNR